MTEDLHTYAGLYALDALDGQLLHEFEAHLAVCADCRQEVDEFHSTAGRLGSVNVAAPPLALRASVLAAIKDVRPEAPASVTVLRRRPRWLAPLAAAAAIVLAFGIVRAVSAPSTRPTAASVVHAADSRIIPLSGPDGVQTVAYLSPRLDRIAVSADGMDPAPAGKSYQVWLIGPNGPESAGLMEPTAGKHLEMLLPGKASGHQTVAITLEPAGGRPQPTGPVLVKGSVTV